jgi:hypothetical protein
MISVKGKLFVGVVVVMQSQTYLLEIIAALQPTSGFTRGLHSRQKQRDENADDRDDHQQFYKRERKPSWAGARTPMNRHFDPPTWRNEIEKSTHKTVEA